MEEIFENMEKIEKFGFEVINDYDKLFNKLYEINNTNLITTGRYQFPISNNYFVTILNTENEKFNNFFDYIFDEKREKDINFDLKTKNNLSWEREQFYFIEPEKTNIVTLGKDIDQVIDIINDSNGEINIILDISFLVNFINKLKDKEIEDHLFDFIIYKLCLSSNRNISNFIIFDGENKYNIENLLYEKIKTIINTKYISPKINKSIVVYKKITSDDTKLYWNILSENDLSIKIKLIENDDMINNFYYGTVNNDESFISEIKIKDILKTNVFELEKNPGIVINVFSLLNN